MEFNFLKDSVFITGRKWLGPIVNEVNEDGTHYRRRNIMPFLIIMARYIDTAKRKLGEEFTKLDWVATTENYFFIKNFFVNNEINLIKPPELNFMEQGYINIPSNEKLLTTDKGRGKNRVFFSPLCIDFSFPISNMIQNKKYIFLLGYDFHNWILNEILLYRLCYNDNFLNKKCFVIPGSKWLDEFKSDLRKNEDLGIIYYNNGLDLINKWLTKVGRKVDNRYSALLFNTYKEVFERFNTFVVINNNLPTNMRFLFRKERGGDYKIEKLIKYYSLFNGD